MLGVPERGLCVDISPSRGGRVMKMKEGWEGLTVALWMLFIVWIVVALIKLLF
jgi:hypothetical protein